MTEDPRMEKAVVELSEIMSSRFFGKYRGLVKRVDDPDNVGRITAIVPAIFGNDESPWAFPCSTLAGPDYGFLMLPKEDDGVWIEFEGGDPSRPIWSGFWWSGDDMPSEAGENVRIIITPAGHKLILDDDENQIKIIHSGGGHITMTDDEITLAIGNSTVAISSDSVNVNNGALVVR